MKEFLKNISLSFITLTILLLCLEIILRGLGYTTYQVEKNDSDFIQPDSLLNYKYAGNLDVDIKTKDYSIHVNTNSLGYRDEEWTFDNQQKKILVVGNSFSAGFGLPVEKRWSNLLQEKLNGQQRDEYHIYNAAVSGYSLEQAVNTAKYLNRKINPDVIIVGVFIYGLNRLEDPFVYHKGYSVKKSMVSRSLTFNDQLFILHFENEFLKTIEAFFYDYSALYNFTVERLHNLKDQLSESAPNSFDHLTEKANGLLNELNAQLKIKDKRLIILPIVIHDQKREYSATSKEAYIAIKKFADQNHISFADIYPELKKEVDNGEDFWINKDPHWNEKANLIASEILLQRVLE